MIVHVLDTSTFKYSFLPPEDWNQVRSCYLGIVRYKNVCLIRVIHVITHYKHKEKKIKIDKHLLENGAPVLEETRPKQEKLKHRFNPHHLQYAIHLMLLGLNSTDSVELLFPASGSQVLCPVFLNKCWPNCKERKLN